jgi:hypothetical protein
VLSGGAQARDIRNPYRSRVVVENHPMTTDDLESMLKAEITLLIGLGPPGEQELILRVSPERVVFLRECLEAEGLHVGTALSHAANPWLEILTVSLRSGGVGPALAVALQKFLERHKNKSVTFRPDGKVEKIFGYSAKDVTTMVAEFERLRQQRDTEWAAGLEPGTPSDLAADETDRPRPAGD